MRVKHQVQVGNAANVDSHLNMTVVHQMPGRD